MPHLRGRGCSSRQSLACRGQGWGAAAGLQPWGEVWETVMLAALVAME
jgi:hypothetical protein